MTAKKIFTEGDVQLMIDVNAVGALGKLNAALIMGAVCWGLTASELSLLQIKDVVAEDGSVRQAWTLPAMIAYNGVPRELYTEQHVRPFFEQYLEWRAPHKAGVSEQPVFLGVDPNSRFFLDHRLLPFNLSPRNKESSDYQARAMSAKLKSLINNSGMAPATTSTFRDSWIKTMHDHGCSYKDLLRVSGIKQRETLDRKIKPRQQDLNVVFKKAYAGVRTANKTSGQ